MGGLCDHCDADPALLYCRADAAKLCLACDRHVHAANPIFSKHSRFHLCDGCAGAAAATIFCDAHRLLLCPNCDFDAHPPASDHHRRPLEPLSGCPSALELAAGFGFDEDDKSMWLGGDGDGGTAGWGDGGGLVWDTPSVVCMSDLIVPVEPHLEPDNPDFQVVDVPPPPKHRKVACGKHEEEIIRQLKRLLESESVIYSDCKDADLVPRVHSDVRQRNSTLKNLSVVDAIDYTSSEAPPSCKLNENQWGGVCYNDGIDLETLQYEPLIGNFVEGNSLLTDVTDAGIAEISQVAVSGEVPQPVLLPKFPTKGLREITGPHRESLISRYKEKKKTRRYDKQIRYESRKARADSRVRIRGRFAKAVPDHSGGT